MLKNIYISKTVFLFMLVPVGADGKQQQQQEEQIRLEK